MLSVHGRKPARVVVEPVADFALKIGLTPNTVTIVGAVVTTLTAAILIPLGHLVAAAVISGLFSAFDMIDGTMARRTGGGTRFGSTLDASCDRITDGALFSAIIWWEVFVAGTDRATVAATFVVLVCSQVTSYVKARGEASGFTMVGGLVERPERLIIGYLGIALAGFGVPWGFEVAMWVLALGSVWTVIQRLIMASRDPLAKELSSPPAGA
ncbi:MAG: CDP-alcohol phosphatidyltransferase family protein [Corynebacterium glucuronolyticum]|nr:CDP-alcohol phosphatidyltransferase family protein [Mycobacteriaceae bacterium]MDY5834994.1 CDP-alcohol phosphatidyltransferase family protein [Corynebacterium glucuronolyticum]